MPEVPEAPSTLEGVVVNPAATSTPGTPVNGQSGSPSVSSSADAPSRVPSGDQATCTGDSDDDTVVNPAAGDEFSDRYAVAFCQLVVALPT